MELTYRTRRRLRQAGLTALAALIIAAVVWTCWIIWVERYIVYTREGAVLDFSLAHQDPGEGQLALPPADGEPVSIFYNDGTDIAELDVSLRQVSGFYITADMLLGDLDTLRATIDALPVGTAVMVELKSVRGTYYYTTNIEGTYQDGAMDITAVDQLIADLASRNLYLIASVPAFRDRNFAAEHISSGLPFLGGGGALWLDDGGCYWLDPTDSAVLAYLSQISAELRNLGFDEILFTDFCFPATDQLEFSGNQVTAIQNAAAKLAADCATDRFAVSFLGTGSTVQPVSGRSRLYLTGVEAAQAAATAAALTLEDPAVNLVFLTDSYDTRYNTFSVLRPLDAAAAG